MIGMTTASALRPAPHAGKLLLATDLSPASDAATDEAFELAARLRVPLLIVSVIDPGQLRLPGGHFGGRVDQVRAQREIAAQELVQRGRRVSVSVSFLIWEGDPGEAIIEAARAGVQIGLVAAGASFTRVTVDGGTSASIGSSASVAPVSDSFQAGSSTVDTSAAQPPKTKTDRQPRDVNQIESGPAKLSPKV